MMHTTRVLTHRAKGKIISHCGSPKNCTNKLKPEQKKLAAHVSALYRDNCAHVTSLELTVCC